jgi:uncharacterized protein YoxC
VSWASEALAAIRKIILFEERIDQVTQQVKLLSDSCQDMNTRLHRLEAKFELIERAGRQSARRLPPAKPQN